MKDHFILSDVGRFYDGRKNEAQAGLSLATKCIESYFGCYYGSRYFIYKGIVKKQED